MSFEGQKTPLDISTSNKVCFVSSAQHQPHNLSQTFHRQFPSRWRPHEKRQSPPSYPPSLSLEVRFAASSASH
ncbi:hypothetical protein CLAIMM_04961 [Cladophialophora immunda]|nr:hypothetical protein CLAIMM_04961 [Cladophialophora immunda]